MSVIPAVQMTEAGRWEVQSQPVQLSETQSQNKQLTALSKYTSGRTLAWLAQDPGYSYFIKLLNIVWPQMRQKLLP
jgi:hypothetical protein